MKIFELQILGLTIAPTYYGLMYAIGFLAAYYIILKRAKLTPAQVESLFAYVFLGVVLGGRLGYILFYNLESYLQNPLGILRVWEGGMSFHGGALGVVVATILFGKLKKINFFTVIDEIALTVTIGLGLGRIGNYLNGELLGYSGYTGPFAVNGRFPSPLLEAFLEGLVLFCILLYVAKNKKFEGQVGASFLIGYGVFRSFVEIFFRTPDAQLGYILGPLSMGAILSIVMILVGIFFYIKLIHKK